MVKRYVFGGLVLTVIFVAGCQDAHKSVSARDDKDSLSQTAANHPPRAATEPAPAEGQPGMAVDSAAIARTLAAKVQNATQSLGPLIDRSAQTSAPSGVEWIDPDAMRLSDLPPRHQGAQRAESADAQPTVVQLIHPVVASSPTAANQVAYATGSGAAGDGKGDGRIGGPMPSGMRIAPDVAAPPPTASTFGSNDPLEQKLAQRARDYPHDVGAQLDYQLLQFLHDEPVPQLDALTPLPGEDRELISATLDGLSNFRNVLRADNNTPFSRKARPLLELADRLRSQADLNIPTLALCTKVDGFGIYEPIEPTRFEAGKDHMVVLYCEVENFHSQQDDKRMWVTKLQQQSVLYTESGMQVWEDKTRSVLDLSRNRRHDFFIVKLVKLPAALSIGRYSLKVTVVDQQANRVAESTVPVEIMAE